MTSAMNDAFGSFPGRPDHPDFWKLSELVLANDALIEDALRRSADEANAAYEKKVNAVVDLASLTYTAFQRAIRALGIETTTQVAANQEIISRMTVVFIDAFILGTDFASVSSPTP